MDIFNYHPVTKEYLNTVAADLDPIEQKPLIPAHATEIQVITPSSGHLAIFNGSGWDEVEDNRGFVYETTSAKKIYYSHLGALPSEFTQLVPSQFDKWDGAAWVLDLSVKKDQRKIEMTQAFDADVNAGLTTSISLKMDADLPDILRFDAGVRLTENLSLIAIDVRDFNNTVTSVTLTDAKDMVNELGANYQMLLSKKWARHKEIDDADQTELDAITWS